MSQSGRVGNHSVEEPYVQIRHYTKRKVNLALMIMEAAWTENSEKRTRTVIDVDVRPFVEAFAWDTPLPTFLAESDEVREKEGVWVPNA